MDVEIECRCGKVQGWLRDASPRTVNHVVCYCDDCQAYAHHLGRADLLDAHGGTELVQAAPRAVSFDRGTENVKGVHLRPKGLFRWYASCCSTPLGNTATPSVPFVGIPCGVLRGLDAPAARETTFGRSWGLLGKFAIGEPPAGSTKPNLRGFAKVARLVLGWKLRGKAWPHPFFERSGAARYAMTTLSRAERDALQPLCGPK